MAKRMLVAALTIILWSCGSKDDQFKQAPEILPGFTMIPSPNDLDKPGVIIAVDPHGVMQPLGILNNLNTQQGESIVGKMNGSKRSSFSALLDFLAGTKSKVDANSEVEHDITYNIELNDCVQERIAMLQLTNELKEAIDMISQLGQTVDLTNYKFYVITEAVKARKMIYTFDSKDTNNVGFNANIQKIAQVNPNVKWSSTKDFNLSYDLDSPLYVYAKYWTLVPKIEESTGEIKMLLDKEVKKGEPVYKRVLAFNPKKLIPLNGKVKNLNDNLKN